MSSESGRRAYERYRFKNSTCFKTCMLHSSKGGFCNAQREQIDYCLSLDKLKKDHRDYRSEETALEWIEILAEEGGVEVLFDFTLKSRIAHELANTTRDCYTIARKIVEEQKCQLVVL
jgi:hypothetical protein